MKRISLVLAACALATACSPQAEEPAVAAPEAPAAADAHGGMEGGRSARCRPDQFFPRRSFSADTSSIDSASSFFSRRFSSSSVFSFCASDMLIPLYLAFQR